MTHFSISYGGAREGREKGMYSNIVQHTNQLSRGGAEYGAGLQGESIIHNHTKSAQLECGRCKRRRAG